MTWCCWILSTHQRFPERIYFVRSTSGRSDCFLAWNPDKAEIGSGLMKKADMALYDAKRQGRGLAVPFRQELHHLSTRKTHVESILRECLHSDEGLSVVYQKQTTISGGDVVGFEALARLQAPSGEPIPPNEFIPVAEETGLIYEVTEAILIMAMQATITLRQSGFSGRTAINISPKLFSMNVLDLVSKASGLTGCDPEAIELEVTEEVLLSDDANTLESISQLRRAGYSIALDDFGTGYSSFNYLQKFKFDKLKIDREIINGSGELDIVYDIVTAITTLAHALDMKIVAEGVETESVREKLKAVGVEIIQGWIDGMPLSLDDLMMLDDWNLRASVSSVRRYG